MVFKPQPKPEKCQRIGEIRKKERRKKDRAFQNAGPGLCAACGKFSEQRVNNKVAL